MDSTFQITTAEQLLILYFTSAATEKRVVRLHVETCLTHSSSVVVKPGGHFEMNRIEHTHTHTCTHRLTPCRCCSDFEGRGTASTELTDVIQVREKVSLMVESKVFNVAASCC